MHRRVLVHYAFYMSLWIMALPALAGVVFLALALGSRNPPSHGLWLGIALLLPELILALARAALDSLLAAFDRNQLAHLPSKLSHRHF